MSLFKGVVVILYCTSALGCFPSKKKKVCQIEDYWYFSVSKLVQFFSGNKNFSIGKQCEDYVYFQSKHN